MKITKKQWDRTPKDYKSIKNGKKYVLKLNDKTGSTELVQVQIGENMKISRSKLKEKIREVIVDDNEFKAFFQKSLDRAGKSIPDMSKEEKREFFNKIDAAWKGKGEKREIGEAECMECNQDMNETITDQTGIKSSITRSNGFRKAVGDLKRIKWAMSDGVKIFNWPGHGLIFTDGKFEMIIDPDRPMKVVGEFAKARNEFKSLVNNKK